MKYRLYSSEGNSVQLESYLGFFEIGDDNHVTRYLEFCADGTPRRSTEKFYVDEFGRLPERPIDEAEASKSEYGTFVAISSTAFEAIWLNTVCKNRSS